ncbi:UDP-2,3-diacylglucosamine diphosphatase [Rhodoferax sp.]|uniref:UDP-2,3-diacylglucosamine diphosphatase n=1 Tax=Rhodoferax sp. TaxID=50421 RepID=UPI0025DCA328|nr:UDP-2,3-diacylglucosamine diphosphatase [Rhodoferax sp.]
MRETEPHDNASGLPGLWPNLTAPARWRVVDLISDLHLQAAEPATFAAWKGYMESTQADAVFILGDLFEVWVGDDGLDEALNGSPGFEWQCQQVMSNAAKRLSLFFMHGNRDFLLGDAFARAAGATLLLDPSTLRFDDKTWLLTHGDTLCLADTAYQQFRRRVRSRAWQDDFLSRPLAQRREIARGLRQQSEAIKAGAAPLVDIDIAAACAWLDASGASTLIHGHTHQPGQELLRPHSGAPLQRLVLSDWDARATPPRLQVLRLSIGTAPKRVHLSGS